MSVTAGWRVGKSSKAAVLTSKFKKAWHDLQTATSPETDYIVLSRSRRLPSSTKTSCILSLRSTRSENQLNARASTTVVIDADRFEAGSEASPRDPRSRSSSLIEEDYEQLSRAPKAFIPKQIHEEPITQLHEICSFPSLSLEMIRIYINTYPFSVKMKDKNGDLPLHVAIKRDEPAALVVNELLRKYPQAAFIKDQHGNLPLFIACVRPKVSAGIIKGLLVVNPQAASTKVYGSLALQALVHSGGVTPETIRLLLAANPRGACTPNSFGNIPLHYLCAHERPNIECLRLLLEAYPEGITCMNKMGDTPISRALSQTCRNDSEEIRDSMRLLLRSALHSIPEVLSAEQLKTLRQLNWDARRNIVMMCATTFGEARRISDSASALSVTAEAASFGMALAQISTGMYGVWRNILEYL